MAMTTTPRILLMVVAAGLCGATEVFSQTASTQKPPAKATTTAAKPAPSPTPPAGAKAFATPQAAAAALIQAASVFDEPALIALVGPDGKDLVTTEDPVLDKSNAAAFAAWLFDNDSSTVGSLRSTGIASVGQAVLPLASLPD